MDSVFWFMESGDVAVSHDDKVMDNALVLDSDNGDDTVSDRWYEFSRVFTCEVVEYAAKSIDSALFADNDSGDDTVRDRWYEFSRVFTCEVVEYAAKSIDSALFADNDSGSEAVIVPCFVPIKVVMVVAKFGSSFSAVANSLSVSRAAGLEFTKLAIAVETLEVVA